MVSWSEHIFPSEKFAFPELNVKTERTDEYKDPDPYCRLMCSTIYLIELNRSFMSIGYVDESSLNNLSQWYAGKRDSRKIVSPAGRLTRGTSTEGKRGRRGRAPKNEILAIT
jgi:hypothetical protein